MKRDYRDYIDNWNESANLYGSCDIEITVQ